MADAASYHKLEADEGASSDQPAWTAQQTSRGRSSWHVWARLAGEVVLILVVIVLSVRTVLHDGQVTRNARGRNEPRKACEHIGKQCKMSRLADETWQSDMWRRSS